MLASEPGDNTEPYSLKIKKSEENESDPQELGWVSLFKTKICYFLVFVMYKRETLFAFYAR